MGNLQSIEGRVDASFRRMGLQFMLGTADVGDLAISRGDLEGFFEVNKFGRNDDIDTASTPEDVWQVGGLYTGFPSESETVDIVSTDANDAAAGTGARTVEISGLDDSWAVQSEVLTLNGLTSVTSTGTYRRVNRMKVRAAGSGAQNAGTLTLNHTITTANVFGTIEAGVNQTQIAAYTVPAGYTGFITAIFVAIRGGVTSFVDGNVAVRDPGEVFRPIREFGARNEAPYDRDLKGGLPVDEMADIVIRINQSGANNTAVVADFDIRMVSNSI